MPDAYSELAIRVMRHSLRPVTAKQIMSIAQSLGIVPEHLRGATQYKTLQARLSEQILRRGAKSVFYRTGPGVFFLRELATSHPGKEWLAPRRSKELGREIVLALPREYLVGGNLNGTIENIEPMVDLLNSEHAVYVDRKVAETDKSLKQVVTYIIVSKGNLVLSYRRGRFSNAGDEIRGARSIGFGGHVTEHDSDFLDRDYVGIYNNAIRELLEELRLTGPEVTRIHSKAAFHFYCFLNVDDTEEAQKHIAAVVVYSCSSNFEPKKGELSINDLNWLDLDTRINQIDDFELWSRILLDKLFDRSSRAQILSSHATWLP